MAENTGNISGFQDVITRTIKYMEIGIYDYRKTHESLLDMTRRTLNAIEKNGTIDADKWVLVYAGPNASGKSTIAAKLNQELMLPFVNPDMLAKLCYSHIEDEETRYRVHAMPHAELLRKNFAQSGSSFSFETVFSDPRKLNEIDILRRCGYRIGTVWLCTENPAINEARALIREAEGGHHVPPDKIITRYYKSMNNLNGLLQLSDKAVVIDNSCPMPIVLIEKSQGEYHSSNEGFNSQWIHTYIPLLNEPAQF
ncbi:hypothetical protein UF75_4456 [Desulfosporosinus sp. I2]|uniref:zeta toxin family protein n=1 Tax=Desulfosporosinus sp. I2 TaxID=1617025 RepID=UPI0005F038F2|nr:zeta toxin family protein [Desulfosporosinus sp. I2]KJR45151.1 hypothetical protein UF75_4456 [Desulfosporosinus sp. I2]